MTGRNLRIIRFNNFHLLESPKHLDQFLCNQTIYVT